MMNLDAFLSFDLEAFISIIFIDLVMSGDNAIIIGMAAAGLPPEQRRKAICFGILAATLMRIGFALVTYELLSFIGQKQIVSVPSAVSVPAFRKVLDDAGPEEVIEFLHEADDQIRDVRALLQS